MSNEERDILPLGIIRAADREEDKKDDMPAPYARSTNAKGTGRITAIEPQARRQGRVNVFVDGKFALGLFEEVALALSLHIGQQISPERLTEISQAETLRRAKEDAFRLLSFRGRSEKEIEDRLRRKGYEEDLIAQVIASLRGNGYVDDVQFAQNWVAARGRTRGRRALAHELRQKGITGELAAETLQETRDDAVELAAARAAAIKKVGERPADHSREAQARLAAFLQRRGFGWDVVRPVLAELYAGADEDAQEFDT